MPSKTFNYETRGMNDVWVQHFDTGNIRWNQRVGSRIGRDTSSMSVAYAGYYGSQEWAGLTTSYGLKRDSNRWFKMEINVDRLRYLFLDGPGGSTAKLVKESRETITHELGHTLCLSDNPNTKEVSIMKYADTDANRTEVPTAYDIADVERVYG
ncbi:MAG TPA: hypothetical protein VFO77_16065 [Actinoplanes sp.]|nr:hypothetical protein [Actinoplanes sp.]